MQIIRDVEAAPRGVYCGAIGWVAPPSRAGPGAVQRRDPDQRRRPIGRDHHLRHRRWHHLAVRPGSRARRTAARRQRSCTRRTATCSWSRRWRSSTGALRHLDRHLATARVVRVVLRLSVRRAALRDQLTAVTVGADVGPCAADPRPSRPNRGRARSAASSSVGSGHCCGRRRAGRLDLPLAVPQDDEPRRLHGSALAGTPRSTTSSWSTSAVRSPRRRSPTSPSGSTAPGGHPRSNRPARRHRADTAGRGGRADGARALRTACKGSGPCTGQRRSGLAPGSANHVRVVVPSTFEICEHCSASANSVTLSEKRQPSV